MRNRSRGHSCSIKLKLWKKWQRIPCVITASKLGCAEQFEKFWACEMSTLLLFGANDVSMFLCGLLCVLAYIWLHMWYWCGCLWACVCMTRDWCVFVWVCASDENKYLLRKFFCLCTHVTVVCVPSPVYVFRWFTLEYRVNCKFSLSHENFKFKAFLYNFF